MAENTEPDHHTTDQEGGEMLPLRAVESELGLNRTTLLKMIGDGKLASEKKWLPGAPPQHYVSREELERVKRERTAVLQQPKRGRGRPPKAPQDGE